jgi:hypothetical protein
MTTSTLFVLVVVAMLLLGLRALGIHKLSESDLAEIKNTKCPICRKNLLTIIVICHLAKGLYVVEERFLKFLHATLW